MSDLAKNLNLFDKRFGDLLEIGRARLPSLAPDWTDHNAHDPGITLMELLAWVAEAQFYSLGHMRRDERVAYAALLGLTPGGTQGARGLIWPDTSDPSSPVKTYTKTMVLSKDTVINMTEVDDSPIFQPRDTLLWVPGSIQKLVTRHSSGQTTDHTSANGRNVAFLPFGESAGRHAVLSLEFQCRDNAGLFRKDRRSTRGAHWPIGVLAASPGGGAAVTGEPEQDFCSSLKATLINNGQRQAVTIASDTTQSLLTTGVVLLNFDDVVDLPQVFTIELNAPGGFTRPPRVLRIEPNVIPIEQGRTIMREVHNVDGALPPDWSFSLNVLGLRFSTGQDPITLEVDEPTGSKVWSRCDRLSERSPDENVYELDARKGQVMFGNGVNGRIPPAGSQVFVTYVVSDGEQGNVTCNRKWKVTGIDGVFGINPDPITGGAAPFGWFEQRREARRRLREDHALVTAVDIQAAAQALPLLEVARAWVPEPDTRSPRIGAVTLVVMRSRPAGKEPEQPPETPRWLETIHRRLAPRMPLGSRLVVVAPRYVEFSIQAELEADLGRNPSDIKKEVEKELNKRLALVATAEVTPRQPGVPVIGRDIYAWIRAIDGVKRVVTLQLLDANGRAAPNSEITVPRNGLPRWNADPNRIKVFPPEPGRPR